MNWPQFRHSVALKLTSDIITCTNLYLTSWIRDVTSRPMGDRLQRVGNAWIGAWRSGRSFSDWCNRRGFVLKRDLHGAEFDTEGIMWPQVLVSFRWGSLLSHAGHVDNEYERCEWMMMWACIIAFFLVGISGHMGPFPIALIDINWFIMYLIFSFPFNTYNLCWKAYVKH